MSRRTGLATKVLAMLRMLSRFLTGAGAFSGTTFGSVLREGTGLLGGFHVVPYLGVLRAPRHILPEVNALLVVVDVI